jgi:hypothetical protein
MYTFTDLFMFQVFLVIMAAAVIRLSFAPESRCKRIFKNIWKVFYHIFILPLFLGIVFVVGIVVFLSSFRWREIPC